MNQYRILKIYQKFRSRRWDNTTVPSIRLEGKWLEKLGFEKGEKVKVESEKDKFIITTVDRKLRPTPKAFVLPIGYR